MKETKINCRRSNIIFGALIMIFGLMIQGIIITQKYIIWKAEAPGGGLFPAIAGAGIILCGIGIMGEQKKSNAQEIIDISIREKFNFVTVLGIAMIIVVLSKYLGFLPCIGLGIIFYTKLLAQESWKKSIVIGLCTAIVMYLIFVVFLKVHFPKGIFGI